MSGYPLYLLGCDRDQMHNRKGLLRTNLSTHTGKLCQMLRWGKLNMRRIDSDHSGHAKMRDGRVLLFATEKIHQFLDRNIPYVSRGTIEAEGEDNLRTSSFIAIRYFSTRILICFINASFMFQVWQNQSSCIVNYLAWYAPIPEVVWSH